MEDERKPPDEPRDEVQEPEELSDEQLDRIAAGYATVQSDEINTHKSGPTNYN
jgi:hypothetical protein